MYWLGSSLNGLRKQWAAEIAQLEFKRVAPQYILPGDLTLTTAIIQGQSPGFASCPPIINLRIDGPVVFESPQPGLLMVASFFTQFDITHEQFDFLMRLIFSTLSSPGGQTIDLLGHKYEQSGGKFPLQIQICEQSSLTYVSPILNSFPRT